jgi:hypothetical protein
VLHLVRTSHGTGLTHPTPLKTRIETKEQTHTHATEDPHLSFVLGGGDEEEGFRDESLGAPEGGKGCGQVLDE